MFESSPHVIGDDVLGLYHGYPSPKIQLLRGMEREVSQMTLLHEALHAIEDVYGLSLGERRIRVLEQALGQILGQVADFSTTHPASKVCSPLPTV